MVARIILFNLLTLGLLPAVSSAVFSSYAVQEKQKTYLRWKLSAPKNHILVKREGERIWLKTSNESLFSHLKREIQNFDRDGQYMERIEFDPSGKENGFFSIQVLLKKNIELFAFYRDREKKHVIDFWKERTMEGIVAEKPKPSKKVKPVVQKVTVVRSAKKKVEVEKKKGGYRDFRYGASFYWNYAPLEIRFKKIVDLKSKTPEFFYPIEDRDYKKSDKEAHVQLSINMYRKRKWGLMYNSIKIYRDKYGEADNFEINEYLKANAIIRSSFQKQEKGPLKAALNILSNIEKKSRNYALRKGIVKYLLQYHLDGKDHVAALRSAKNLYVMTVENNDGDAKLAAQALLYSLSKLNQIADIQKILEEKGMSKYLSKNTVLLYEIYSYMKMGKSKDVISIYNREKGNFAKPLHESILFNVGEAAFREARLEMAIKLFDDFVANYSHHTFSSMARVRLALAYEMLQKPFKEVAFLYKNAINRSQDAKSSMEARVRYVALRNLVKINPTKEDRESRLFLNIDEKEHINVDVNIKKTLWLVRVRLLILEGKYEDAFAYLKTIPLETLKPIDKRVFDAEGAEILYGVISDLYKHSKYSEIIKFWNIYKDKYVSKIAKDSVINFIVGKSYLKLGLYDEFDSIYKNFEKLSNSPEKSFPLWIERKKTRFNSEMAQELLIDKHLKLGNLELAQRDLNRLKKKKPTNERIKYYQGVIFYNKKEYVKSSKEIEKFLSKDRNKGALSPDEIGNLLMFYTDSIYKQGDMDKFKRTAQAILNDTDRYAPENKHMKSLRERLSYLVIEITFSEHGGRIYPQLAKNVLSFKENHKASIYSDRVDYILGRYYVNNKKLKEAKEIFNKILSKEDVSKNVKGLVKAELAMMSIQEKNL